MSSRTELSDRQWKLFHALLLHHEHVYVGAVEKCRCFLNAALWILRSGTQRRLLPAALEKWNFIFKHFSRWYKLDVWKRMHAGRSEYPDLQHLLIDSTITRAHACAAVLQGARPKPKRWDDLRAAFRQKSM